MSYKIFTCMSNVRDWWNRARKSCVCGSHSAHDIKKNKNHNSTKKKLQIRDQRNFKLKQKEEEDGQNGNYEN